MPHWNTQDIIKLCQVPGVIRTDTIGFGGDYDTTEVLLSFFEKETEESEVDGLSIQGFKFGEPLDAKQRDEVDLTTVVLRNWLSDSGVQTEEPVVAAAAALIRKALRAAGFSVYDHYEDFY